MEAKIILLQTIKNVPLMGLIGNDPSVIFYSLIRIVVVNMFTGPIAVIGDTTDNPKQTHVALLYFAPNSAS